MAYLEILFVLSLTIYPIYFQTIVKYEYNYLCKMVLDLNINNIRLKYHSLRQQSNRAMYSAALNQQPGVLPIDYSVHVTQVSQNNVTVNGNSNNGNVTTSTSAISQPGLYSQNLATNTNATTSNNNNNNNDSNNTNSNTNSTTVTQPGANGNDNKEDDSKDDNQNDESKQESEGGDEKTDDSKKKEQKKNQQILMSGIDGCSHYVNK